MEAGNRALRPGQYHVEQREIDRYVERLYAETKDWIATHPLRRDAAPRRPGAPNRANSSSEVLTEGPR